MSSFKRIFPCIVLIGLLLGCIEGSGTGGTGGPGGIGPMDGPGGQAAPSMDSAGNADTEDGVVIEEVPPDPGSTLVTPEDENPPCEDLDDCLEGNPPDPPPPNPDDNAMIINFDYQADIELDDNPIQFNDESHDGDEIDFDRDLVQFLY